MEDGMTERTSPVSETLREAVATELIAHGEFSTTYNNNYSNALYAADAVIAIVQSRGHAPRLPERVPVKLTESAHRLWMCINGHDINDFYDRAEFILRTSLDGLQVGLGNRATIKALLVEHFEQIAKTALSDTTPSRDEIARIIDQEAMGLAHKLGRPDLALTDDMQERIRTARAKADEIVSYTRQNRGDEA
jgi:hypothetical protein